ISAGSVKILSTHPLASGTPLQAKVVETYELLSGSKVDKPSWTMDLTAYNYGQSGLKIDFPLSSDQSLTVRELKSGTMDTDLFRSPTSLSGVVVGADGGSVSGEGGAEMVISSGSVTNPVMVALQAQQESTLPLAAPPPFRFLGALRVTMGGATLGKAAVLSLPVDSALISSLPVGSQFLLCRIEIVDGSYRVLAVQTAMVDNGRIRSLLPESSLLSFPGVREEGLYIFLAYPNPAGFFKGTVLAKGLPKQGALVTVNTHAVASLSCADGSYALLAPLSLNTLQALDLGTRDLGQGQGSLTASGEIRTLDLTILPTGPKVVAVTPADKATSVPLDSSVSFVFSEAVKPGTFTSSSVNLFAGATRLEGVVKLSVDCKQGEFIPAKALPSDRAITITLRETITDLAGNPLVPTFTSSFRTLDTEPPTSDLSRISLRIPENGVAHLIGRAGAVEPGATVVLTNLRTGEVVTGTGLSDGSFDLTISALFSDTLTILVRDSAGNQIALPSPPFSSQDGKSVVLGSEEFRYTTPEGLGISVEGGTFSSPVLVRLEGVADSGLLGVAPESFSRLQALRVDLGGARANKPFRLSIPTPSGLPADSQLFIAREVELFGEKKLMVLDTCAFKEGNRIEVNSPPWPGVTKEGVYSFLVNLQFRLGFVNASITSLPSVVEAIGLVFFCDQSPQFIFPVPIN
ncbi:MAG TPA: Ig-like domain-containing protein, partial [Candidatus Aminicenantes bacterium]|nr:Ig-like domain-containing protein [Candidatus Aminicenantes bacterium]